MKKKKISAVILSRFASPEAIDHIMVQKFVEGHPLFIAKSRIQIVLILVFRGKP